MDEPSLLGQKLADWLDQHGGARSMAREDGRYSDGRHAYICILNDRGVERYAASPLSWPDAVLKALVVARFADLIEQATRQTLPTEGVFYP